MSFGTTQELKTKVVRAPHTEQVPRLSCFRSEGRRI
jgi:hypothetical protein